MRFLIDENLPVVITERLLADGHQVELVGKLRLSMSDLDVVKTAAPGQVIVTQDKDFGELVVREQRPSHGVILVRLEGMSLQARAERVAQTIDEFAERLVASFTVIGHGGVRRQALSQPDTTQE